MRKFAFLVLVVSLALSTVSSAGLLREIWDGGRNIDEAIALANSGTPADQVEILDNPEEWVDIADNYSARLSGWLVVPATGEYTFYVAGDDYNKLWVSQDDNPANAEIVAYVDGWTAHMQWDSYASQKADPMTLTEGQVLSFVGIMQEGGGGDSMTFGWTGPGIDEVTFIPGENFIAEHEVTAAAKAMVVSPANGATGVIDAVAAWNPPADPDLEAPLYDVYGGTDPAELGLLAEGIVETTFNAGSAGAELETDTTYYWRVDTNGAEGFVWSFTTEPATFAVEGIIATSTATTGDAVGEPQQTVDGSGLNENDEHNTESMDMWLGVPAAGEAVSIQYEFPRVYKLDEMLAWNSNTGFEGFLGYGFKDVTIEYSVDGAEWTVLADVEFAQAAGAEGLAAGTIVDFGGVGAKFVKLTANTNWGGLFPDSGLSEVRFMYIPAQARLVGPADGATGVSPDVVLDWYAGRGAVAQDVSIDGELVASPEDSSFAPELVYGMPYTWAVDTSDGVDVWEGDVWSFSTNEFVSVAAGQWLVYTGEAAAVESILDPAQDLGAFGADTLRLSFAGYANDPNFIYEPNAEDGSITISAAGDDIWGSQDAFNYAYQSLTGDADLVVRVDSIDNITSTWAKAGIMIRQNLEPGSIHADTFVTGGSGGGATFQYRTTANAGSGGQRTLEGEGVVVAPPYYARLVREGNTFTGYFSTDGVEWLFEGTVELEMVDPVFVGLALTSHDSGSTVVAKMSEYSGTGDITGDVATMGIKLSNDPAGLSVTVEDSAGVAATVANADPEATTLAGTQQWAISLAALADAGVDLSSVAKVTVSTDNAAGGSGLVSIGAISAGTPMSHNVTADVTGPDDIIVGVPNDGLMDGDNFGWPGAETPNLCLDNDTATKFLHFKGELEPTGIQVAPAVGPTVVTGLALTTANDCPERDPASFEVYGSNDSIDGPYELIAAGDVVDFVAEEAWPRFTANATEITFENATAYTYYQVLFPTVRDAGAANSMQIAEVELIGVSSW